MIGHFHKIQNSLHATSNRNPLLIILIISTLRYKFASENSRNAEIPSVIQALISANKNKCLAWYNKIVSIFEKIALSNN